MTSPRNPGLRCEIPSGFMKYRKSAPRGSVPPRMCIMFGSPLRSAKSSAAVTFDRPFESHPVKERLRFFGTLYLLELLMDEGADEFMLFIGDAGHRFIHGKGCEPELVSGMIF